MKGDKVHKSLALNRCSVSISWIWIYEIDYEIPIPSPGKYQPQPLEGTLSHIHMTSNETHAAEVAGSPPNTPALPMPGNSLPLRKPGSTLNSMVFSLSHYILPQLQNDLAKVPQSLLLLSNIQTPCSNQRPFSIWPQPIFPAWTPLTLYTAATLDKSCSCLFAVVHAVSSWSLSPILTFWNSTSFLVMQMSPLPLLPAHFSRVISPTLELTHHILHPTICIEWFLYVHLFSSID